MRSAIGLTLRLLVGAILLAEGAAKFGQSHLWTTIFERIGFGMWFRYFTGATEIGGAILLVIPRTILAGAALLAATMLGALVTHVFVIGVGPQTAFVVVLLGLLLIIARMYRARRA